MITIRHASMALASAASLALVACDNGPSEEGDPTVEAAAEQDKDNLASAIAEDSTMAKAVDAAGLGEVLAGPGPYTVLVPSDEAFAALPDGTLDELMTDEGKEQLGKILSYHMMPGTILPDDIRKAIEAGDGSAELPTLGGGTLTATMDGDNIMVADESGNTARLGTSNENLENGVTYHIDGVLMPS